MSDQFTSGPWVVDPDPRPCGAYQVLDPDHLTVCFIATNGKIDDEHVANAELIAAAPDLLAALREVDRHLNGAWPGDQLFTQVRAAIVKAQGQ